MQAVSSLFSTGGGSADYLTGGQASDGTDLTMPGSPDFSGGGGAGGGGGSSDILGALRLGTSAVSAISAFTLSRYQANALTDEAADERIAARGEYVQAQEKSNQINLAYNRVIGAQLADASAGNVDIASGSVQEAGAQAAQQRDRAVTAGWATAQTNASLRQARAGFLDASARLTRTTGLLSAISDFGRGLAGFEGIGGQGGGGGGGLDISQLAAAAG